MSFSPDGRTLAVGYLPFLKGTEAEIRLYHGPFLSEIDAAEKAQASTRSPTAPP